MGQFVRGVPQTGNGRARGSVPRPGRVRSGRGRHGARHAARGIAPRLGRRGDARRRGHAREHCSSVLRRAAPGHAAGLHRRGERPRQPETVAGLAPGGALRGGSRGGRRPHVRTVAGQQRAPYPFRSTAARAPRPWPAQPALGGHAGDRGRPGTLARVGRRDGFPRLRPPGLGSGRHAADHGRAGAHGSARHRRRRLRPPRRTGRRVTRGRRAGRRGDRRGWWDDPGRQTGRAHPLPTRPLGAAGTGDRGERCDRGRRRDRRRGVRPCRHDPGDEPAGHAVDPSAGDHRCADRVGAGLGQNDRFSSTP